ncbi:hypothetical protein VKT23_011599 [Stygiomarasmius scandens]|uniref:Uncharacterized protein n=1 Tax=Marasmiellus scandens TaxID=2682957 RepID=A0ABR1J8R8_9AGAR
MEMNPVPNLAPVLLEQGQEVFYNQLEVCEFVQYMSSNDEAAEKMLDEKFIDNLLQLWDSELARKYPRHVTCALKALDCKST